MHATYFVLGAAVILAGCSDVRVGLKSVPLSEAQSNDAALGAIRNVLPPDHHGCSLELVKAGANTQVSENTSKQILSVKVCGEPQNFAIQRTQTDGAKVLIVAQRM